jgi:probable F420-dependent oxidoreductase
MPYSRPAARMREFVHALRAIWHAWDSGTPLAHDGEFYRHTLMPPNFVPPASEYGPPRVFLAAVGPLMLRVASEVADGLFVHPFTTPQYLREVILPEVEQHRPATAPPLEIALSPFVALDDDDVEAVRRKTSFYASTPTYRPVLEQLGLGELQTELNGLSKHGRWDTMATLVSDDLLASMCSVGDAREVATDLRGRVVGPERFVDVVQALRAA